MPSIIFFIIGLLFALIRLATSKTFKDKAKRYELILLYYIFFVIGINGVLNFIAHTVYAVQTAESIGWPPNNPFQTEVAFANLSYGIAGILAIWFRGKFWFATIITNGVFLFSAGIGHILQIINNHNYSVNNAGAILYTDLLTPIVGLILYYLYERNSKENNPYEN
jgi:hypothetical protein